MKNKFEQWLEKNHQSLRQANLIKTISNDLEKAKYSDYDIFSINDLQKAKRVKEDYFNIDEYYDKNERGHNMYNSAFNRYLEFLESSLQITRAESTLDNVSPNAFFENGVYESVLEEILEAQKIKSNITCYIQPYSTGKIVFLNKIKPSKDNPITFYISTTSNLSSVSYTAEINC